MRKGKGGRLYGVGGGDWWLEVSVAKKEVVGGRKWWVGGSGGG